MCMFDPKTDIKTDCLNCKCKTSGLFTITGHNKVTTSLGWVVCGRCGTVFLKPSKPAAPAKPAKEEKPAKQEKPSKRRRW